MRPFPSPNIQANPTAQNRIPHRQVSAMHSSMMFTVSLDLANPTSSAMKPACMKKTRKAVTSTHMVFVGLMRSSAAGASWRGAAPAGVPRKCVNSAIAPSTPTRPSIFPPRIAAHSRRMSLSLSLVSRMVMRSTVRTVQFTGISRA
jgi:hypothetical protein